jgi:dienelactone hydrolase
MRFVSERVLTRAAATLDRAVAAAVVASQKRNPTRIERLSHPERVAEFIDAREAYSAPRFFADPDTFFHPPGTIAPTLRRAGATVFRDLRVFDASWASDFQPHLRAVEGRYLADTVNGVAHVRMYLHEEVRPAIILVHGYLTGQLAIEERVWPVRWLHALGFDVAIFALPFHGPRADPERKGPPPLPAADPRLTVEAFRHAIFDLRALVGWFESRGAPHVGTLGMSLGGYTVSLLATVDPRLSFVVPIIPMASVADMARDTGRLGSKLDERAIQHFSYDEAHRVVSPFARPSRVAGERMLVIAAEGDRITPVHHAHRLATHFEAAMRTYPGGHLAQVGIGSCYRAIGELVQGLGIVADRHARPRRIARASGFFERITSAGQRAAFGGGSR